MKNEYSRDAFVCDVSSQFEEISAGIMSDVLKEKDLYMNGNGILRFGTPNSMTDLTEVNFNFSTGSHDYTEADLRKKIGGIVNSELIGGHIKEIEIKDRKKFYVVDVAAKIQPVVYR